MSYGFRVSFQMAGTLESKDQQRSFSAKHLSKVFTLSASGAATIGESNRLSISGRGFATAEEAGRVAAHVESALLRRAVLSRTGLDLGQHSTRGFAMSEEFSATLAKMWGVDRVLPDQLGTTIFEEVGSQKFATLQGSGRVLTPVDALLDDLGETVGQVKFCSERAEIAAAIFVSSFFVGRVPAQFLLQFISIETLLEPVAQRSEVVTVVDQLIDAVRAAELLDEEKQSLNSTLRWMKQHSIHQKGKNMASSLLEGSYSDLPPERFFSRLYGIRNKLVHSGAIDPRELTEVQGELVRFASDLLSRHLVDN